MRSSCLSTEELTQSAADMRKQTSVFVLNWNGRAHLEACLRGLAAQTWRDFDLFVIDNGSSDGSILWLREQDIHPLLLLELGTNRGFAGGNAAGLRALPQETEYVVLLNNDTAPEPGWLGALVKAAKEDSRRGAVASLLVDWEGKQIDSAGIGLRVTGRGYQRYRRCPRSAGSNSCLVFGACAGAALYRRSMLDEVGFLDERFFMNGEDTDLSFRARLMGWDVWYCSEAVVRHRISASQNLGSTSSVFLNERNWIWSVAKCMPISLLWKYSWVYMIESPARGWFFLRQGMFVAWARGILAGIRGAWSYRYERRRIKHMRRISPKELERFLIYPRQLGGTDDDCDSRQ